MNLKQRLSKACDRLACIVRSSRETEGDRVYASQIVDRVLKVIQNYSPEGCPESKFIPAFDLDEADLMDYALRILCNRGVVRREVKYFLQEEK